jgi:hypothetical protein
MKFLLLLLSLCIMAPGCGPAVVEQEDPPEEIPVLNLAHLDYLGQEVRRAGVDYRIVHIYAEAPDYQWVGDDDEGIACVDDATRAAVLYLRHFETTGSAESRLKAEALLRFVMYMQTEGGLFYNFVWNSELDVNQTHANSRADNFGSWAARGVWALGTCARVLRNANPAFADACARRVRRTYPHLDAMLARYGTTVQQNGRTVPTWLLYDSAADATSEMLLGLIALHQTEPDAALRSMIDRFADGIAMMRYGSMAVHPFGMHASGPEWWHAWGNAQVEALTEAGRPSVAAREAEHFYPRLLVEGWRHAMRLDAGGEIVEYEQIAYDVRPVAVGLIRLFEATGDVRYARLAGLAASWFTGNNAAGVVMYDDRKGYGFDGITGPTQVNYNAGAESTIEANLTLLEILKHPEATRWLTARGEPPVQTVRDGKEIFYRIFSAGTGSESRRIGVIMNLTDERLDLLEGPSLEAFLNR